MKIVLACDHAGYQLKEQIKERLAVRGYDVHDEGAFELLPEDDYPEYIARAAKAVSNDPLNVRAVVLGGSGQGEAIVANRFPYVRAVVYAGAQTTKDGEYADMLTLTRLHNDANVLSLGARFLTIEEAEDAILRWLETPFSEEERHTRRIQMIDTLT